MKKRKVLAILNKYAKQLSDDKQNPSLLKIYSYENDPNDKCFSIPRLKIQKSAKNLDDYASVVAEFYLGSTEPMITFRSRKKMSKIIPSETLPVKDAICFGRLLHPAKDEDNYRLLFDFIDRIEAILDCEANRLYLKT